MSQTHFLMKRKKKSDCWWSFEQVPQHFSSGRGGAGNIHRSQSRDQAFTSAGAEVPRGREAAAQHPADITHTGRGGLGNIARSPSRPRGVGEYNSVHSMSAERKGRGNGVRTSSALGLGLGSWMGWRARTEWMLRSGDGRAYVVNDVSSVP